MTSSIGSSVQLAKTQSDFATNKDVVSKKISGESTREEIRKVSQDFESVFMELVLGSMQKTVQKSGFIDGGNAEDIYRGMLDREYSKIMTQQNKNGLASQIEKQLTESMGLNKDIMEISQKKAGHKVYSRQ